MKHSTVAVQIILGLTITCQVAAQDSFPWPVTPFNSSQEITGNFSEYRSTSANGHFHNGTDIPKPDGSPVYSVKNGVVTSMSAQGSSAFVRVNDVAYVHIQPNPSLSLGDSVFAQQTVLGAILSGQGHVHFTNGFVGSERSSVLAGSGLTPYQDPWPPIIRFVEFYQNNTTNKLRNEALSGPVDIVVKVDEQNGPPSSRLSRRNNGTYKIGYKILSADTAQVVFEPAGEGVRFQFDRKPNNAWVNIVYFRKLSSTTSHAYQVTNDVSRDNFWNTADLLPGSYVAMAFTEDTRGNTDTSYVAVQVKETDSIAPGQPELRQVVETEDGMRLTWQPNSDADLAGYRLYFSFDNETWNLFRDETVYTPSVTDTTIDQILRRDVYFRITAVDDAAIPNESVVSDVYGLSNGDFPHKVLIVDGFDRTEGAWAAPNHDFALQYGKAIFAAGISFDTVPNESVVAGLVTLQDYDALVWFVGDEAELSETLGSDEQTLLSDYLNDGGNLFLSGANIAWDLTASDSATAEDLSFVRERLHADFVTRRLASTSISGSSGSIFEGLTLNLEGGSYHAEMSDAVAAISGAQTALEYSNGESAAITYSGPTNDGVTQHLVYLAAPFETIADETSRLEIMRRALNFFFDLSTSVDGQNTQAGQIPKRFALDANYPNPFNPETRIRFHLPQRADVTLTIFNALGKTVRVLSNKSFVAGHHEMVWDGIDTSGRQVASGLYIVRMLASTPESGSFFEQARKLTLLK